MINPTDAGARLAGELILAFADNDRTKAYTLLLESTDLRTGALELIEHIVSVAISCMEMVEGDQWRDTLNQALLALSMQQFEDPNDD